MTEPRPAYEGRSAASRTERRSYVCSCGERFAILLHRAIDARESPDAAAALLAGRQNHARCPICSAEREVQVSVVFHDPEAGRLILFLPDGLRHRELEERALLYRRLADDGVAVPRYVREFQVAFGAAELKALVEPAPRSERQPERAVEPAPRSERQPERAVEPAPRSERQPERAVEPAPRPERQPERAVEPAPRPERQPERAVEPAPRPERQPERAVEPAPRSERQPERAAAPAPHPERQPERVVAAAPRAERQPERLVAPTSRAERHSERVVAAAPRAERQPERLVAPARALRVEDKPPAEEPTAPHTADPSQVKTQLRNPVPEARDAGIDRWIASREGPSALLFGDRVVLCAALPSDQLEPFVSDDLDLRLQLHRLPTYPLFALTVVTAGARSHAVQAPIEVGRAASRAVLERLGRDFSVTLRLYDASFAPIASRDLSAPLEENVKRLFASAKRALQQIAPATRSFERAVAAFAAPGYDRVGRVQVALSPSEIGSLESPRAVRQAVGTVARWSEPVAEGYLVEIRSFPLGEWKSLRTDVVRRSLDLGIHTPRALAERVLAEAGVAATWIDVLRRQVSAFTDMALRHRPNDLTPEDEAENWRLLFEECRAAGVPVDAAVRELAEGRGRSAEGTGAALEAGGDVRGLDSTQLVALLDDRERRRDAALVLCERREAGSPALVFAALRRMTRAEANRVLPAMVNAFGEETERYLIQGLKSRKSYLRQGCALGLGALHATRAAGPLSRLLLEEPTDVWREVARALGDLGDAAVPPLLARLAEARGEVRDRIVRALAHVAAHGGQAAVEHALKGPDPRGREAARRALALQDEVRRSDAEVRGDAPPREQTVVRSFTLRFFEALGGDVELSDADLEELPDGDEEGAQADDGEEQLDEADLLPDGTGPRRKDATDPTMSLPRDRGA